MDVLRDTAVLGLRRNNVKVLQVQLQQTRDRFQVGEVTRTDVAQAESSLASGDADVAVAESSLQTSVASYPPGDRNPADAFAAGAADREIAAADARPGDRDRLWPNIRRFSAPSIRSMSPGTG